MAGAIAHRGPDDAGIWTDEAAGIAIAHRRLSILDLSPLGHQPMTSADGRWIMVYNGEIYNFERIRTQLDQERPRAWRGASDSEVLLEAVASWGVERALSATIGMFALAIWDRRDRELILARDRAGEKPLYYGRSGDGTLLFGSELKALRAHDAFAGSVSPAALRAYMRFGYVPGSASIYEGIHKIAPGSYAVLGPHDAEPRVTRYWRSATARADPTLADGGQALEELETLLTDAVGLQMRADVPMGAFLSGGVDSSTIVALMQRQSSRPVKTFSIGFAEAEFDESEHAAAVAAHLGTEHRQLTVTSQDALAVIPSLPATYDEPFADSSQIPTCLLARLTRQHVTVSLSGDAGDELFGGYTRYFQAQQFEHLWRRVPRWGRVAAAGAFQHVPPAAWGMARRVAPQRFAELLTPGRIAKSLDALRCDDLFDVYRRMVSQWPDPARVVASEQEVETALDAAELRIAAASAIDWMMAADFRTYLPDDILVKVDRASMAASLEARVPFLDHRVIEFAGRLPLEHKARGGKGKLLLRRLLYRYVPPELIERPKQGFAVPIGEWLRGPLRDWAEALLEPQSLEAGLLRPVPIRQLWQDHLAGRVRAEARLWTVLMYQSWRAA